MNPLSQEMIKKRQRWVKDNPARLAEELTAPGYICDVNRNGLLIRTVLSIDLFQAPLAWRCQIALLYPSKLPRPRRAWQITETMAAVQVAESLLAGVGIKSDLLVTDSVSFELVYPCTPDEAEYVVRAALRPATAFESLPVGEINQYDFSDPSTQIAGWWDGREGKEQGLFLPQQRSLIHEPGNRERETGH